MLLKANYEGITVSSQNEQKFWGSRTIRPDIVLLHETKFGTNTYIVNTQ